MAPSPLISKGDLKSLLALELEGRNREHPCKVRGLGVGPVAGGNEDSTRGAVWPCVRQGWQGLHMGVGAKMCVSECLACR